MANTQNKMKKLIIISGVIIVASFILSGYDGNNQDLKEKATKDSLEAVNVVVSADQMNVFYAGIPNQVSVAASVASPNDIIVNANGAGASISGGAGRYIFNFTGTGECIVTVAAKTDKGVKVMGPPIKFRVKPLPRPELNIGGKFGPTEMRKAELNGVGDILAGAINFDFQPDYIVTSWEVSSMINGALKTVTGNGSSLTADGMTLFREAEVGNKIIIVATVRDPAGKAHQINLITKVTK